MSDRKKPGKNSARRGRLKPIPTGLEVSSEPMSIPSPFMRAGFDIGLDISAPRRRQDSNDATTASAAAGDGTTAAAAFTVPTAPGPNVAASTKKNSGSARAARRGRAGVSDKQALALEVLGMKEEEEGVPATD